MNEATATLNQLKKADKFVCRTFRKNGPKSFKKGQGALMRALLEHDGAATQRELVDIIGISRRDLKDVVKKAERNGFVAIEDADAERTYVVKLTGEGRTVAEKRLAANDRTAEEILSCLTEEEIAQLNTITEKLILAAKEKGIKCKKKSGRAHRSCRRHCHRHHEA